MLPETAVAALEVRDEHRIMVTEGTTITWLNIYEVADTQFYAVCGACNESAEATSRHDAGAWARRHVRLVHASSDDEFSTPEPIKATVASSAICGHLTVDGGICQHRVSAGGRCSAGHHR